MTLQDQYELAKKLVLSEETWTALKLQRTMKGGFASAFYCVERLTEDGILSEPKGSYQIRKLLIDEGGE